MSGARGMVPAGAPAAPAASDAPGPIGVAPCMFAPSSTSAFAAGCDRAPKRCPTTSAVRETRASAATAHGRALARPRDGAAEGAPDGVPQRWQNRAPGVSVAEQVEQEAPASAVPQLEQKRPEADAPQLGQRDVVLSQLRRVGLGTLLLELRNRARRRLLLHLLRDADARRPVLPPLRHPIGG